MGENKLDKQDVAEATNTDIGTVSEAWHDARDDAAEAGEIDRGSGPGEDHGQTEVISLDDLKDLEEDENEEAEQEEVGNN